MQPTHRQSQPTARQSMTLQHGIRRRIGVLRDHMRVSARTWRGAAFALIAAIGLVWLWAMLPQLVPSTLFASLLIAGGDVLAAVVLAGVLLVLLKSIAALPRLFLWIVIGGVVLLVGLGSGPSQRGWLVIVAVLVIGVSIIGGGLWSLAGGGWSRERWPRRLLALAAPVLSLAVLLGGAVWLLVPGAPPAAIPNAALLGEPVAPLNAADPAQPGSYRVQALSYGSGKDLHRLEYGANTTLTTASVDASAIVKGWAGWTGAARTRFWGFDATALPINGRVWYPEGEGRFPLVLIVHGNSRAEDFSDAGFAYLGELLASRGFIVASIDENFLNTNLIDSAGGLTGVNAARGWLLLEHLRVWHDWNKQPDNPFHSRIDTDRIALIGHSRGGEAVAVAAAFNRLDRFPDDPAIELSYGYNIRSIIAIAPSDAQYLPLGEKLALQDINYLVLQGSHDADVFSFMGLNQYHRVALSADQEWIKAAVYIYRANHGHFNTTWDAYDLGEGLSAHLIDTAALLPAEEQRRAAQVFVSAFLETTLHGTAAYRDFFRDLRVGRAWLPDTVYIGQYADATTRYLSTYEEDVSVTSTTLDGGTQSATGLSRWQEEHRPLRGGPGDDRAVRLGWQRTTAAEAPRYTITLPPGGILATAGSALRFDLADMGAATVPVASASANSPALTNLTIEVRDADGTSVRLPLSHLAPLQPPIEGRFLKSAFFHDAPLSEPILQTFTLPLADFALAGPDFDPATLAAIAFVFDDTPAGTIMLDNVGIAVP
ncbi:MAG TPA: hypothetical protein VGD69_28745 [Herpetosiphonaceae bacterium]